MSNLTSNLKLIPSRSPQCRIESFLQATKSRLQVLLLCKGFGLFFFKKDLSIEGFGWFYTTVNFLSCNQEFRSIVSVVTLGVEPNPCCGPQRWNPSSVLWSHTAPNPGSVPQFRSKIVALCTTALNQDLCRGPQLCTKFCAVFHNSVISRQMLIHTWKGFRI